MIQIKAFTVCEINGKCRRNTIKITSRKVIYETQKDIERFRSLLKMFIQKKSKDTIEIHLQTKER